MLSRVLVPMDDSEMAERALEFAMTAHPDADITVLHVAGGPSPLGGDASAIALADDVEATADEYAEVVFDRARAIADEHDAEVELEVQLGHPVRAILNRAEGYDVVVIGSHGGSLADRLFIGNVAEKIFRRCPVPVTVVR